ncbi:hypothetical protein NM208_g10666 [Fusarium decemcellulare]|uniref:Uncharacterized protein n=1 Tax=Fusarium decemcellulare TaxID=57161 RepID=A0ACC1RX40_9HYPO|nr:hypothetical protein NM208_g10666 [Fusarium decemcellulare]
MHSQFNSLLECLGFGDGVLPQPSTTTTNTSRNPSKQQAAQTSQADGSVSIDAILPHLTTFQATMAALDACMTKFNQDWGHKQPSHTPTNTTLSVAQLGAQLPATLRDCLADPSFGGKICIQDPGNELKGVRYAEVDDVNTGLGCSYVHKDNTTGFKGSPPRSPRDCNEPSQEDARNFFNSVVNTTSRSPKKQMGDRMKTDKAFSDTMLAKADIKRKAYDRYRAKGNKYLELCRHPQNEGEWRLGLLCFFLLDEDEAYAVGPKGFSDAFIDLLFQNDHHTAALNEAGVVLQTAMERGDRSVLFRFEMEEYRIFVEGGNWATLDADTILSCLELADPDDVDMTG